MSTGTSKTTEYMVVTARDIVRLTEEVEGMLAAGWQLQGGVSTSTSPEWYAQALTKDWYR